jgi:hypothetical protein
VLWALVVSESAWAYSILGVLGLWVGEGGSPLSWPTVVALMVVSLYVGGLGPSKVLGAQTETAVRMLIGLLAIYVAIGFELGSGLPGIDLAWALKAFSGARPEGYWPTTIVGGFAGAILWLRAGRLAVSSYPTDELAFSFRLGIPVLALATLIDIANDANLDTFVMVFVFFGAALAGLALGHLLPRSQQNAGPSIWPRVILGVVAVVVVIGLTFSLVPGAVLDLISSPFLVLIQAALIVFAWVFIIPAAFVVSAVAEGLIWLYNLLFGATGQLAVPVQEQATSTPSVFEEIEELEGSGANLWVMQMLLGILVGVIAIGLLYAGAKAFRRTQSRTAAPVEGQRESVIGDADPLLDLANLLWNLRPSWLKRSGEEQFVLPDGPPGIVKVLEVYYDLLVLAEERGFGRQPHETPGEVQSRLDLVFPGEVVHAATAAFVRAFYGNYPSSEEQIAEMRASVDRLAAEPA